MSCTVVAAKPSLVAEIVTGAKCDRQPFRKRAAAPPALSRGRTTGDGGEAAGKGNG